MEPVQPAPTLDITNLKLNRTGLIRTIVTTAVACLGGLMWGYDSGVVSGVLSLPSFKDKFGINAHNSSKVSSNAVSLLQAGGFFGALFISPVCQKFGRRLSMVCAALVFIVGAVMQIAGTGGLPLFYVGRVIAGLGVGAATCVVPTYASEVLPKKIRGTMMGTWQFWIVTGVTISYWIDYGVNQHVTNPASQWRIPLGVQIVPAGLLILGTLYLKESPRWLAKQGEDDKALANLAYMRGLEVSSPEVQAEYQEIYQALLQETEVTGGVTWREMLLPGNRKRALIGFVLMAGQQFSGTNAIGYYAPQIFEAVGVSNTSTGLFATGIYGVVKMVMTLSLCLFAIERFGRRWCLVVGGFFMGLFMMIIGVLLKTHPPVAGAANLSSASYGMVVCIYLYVTAYCFSWGPVPWVYASEIFPNRIREYCVALCAASQWLFNFVVTQFSPYALSSLGWGIFMLFMGFNFLNVIGAFFLKETTGLGLEEMDTLFGAPTAIDNAKVREQAVQDAYDAKHDVEFIETAVEPNRSNV